MCSGARLSTPTSSTAMTVNQITALITVNIQISLDRCSLCGPCGSSTDCQPTQPLKARRAGSVIQSLSLPRIGLTWVGLGQADRSCALMGQAVGFRPDAHSF